MFKEMKDKKKISYSNVLQKLTQENVSIYKQMEKISSERNKLRNELIQIKEEKSSGQEQIIQENNKLKTKVFLLEQQLMKTENIVEHYKKRIEKKNPKMLKKNELNNIRSKSQNNSNNKKNYKKNYTNPTNPNDKTNININPVNKQFFENIVEKKKNDSFEETNEVYILEPSKALLKLNNELLFYKESHQKFLDKLKKKQETITKYENMINKLNTENSELKKAYKLKLMKVNNEKENILSMIVQNNLNIEEQSNNNNNILNKNKKMSSGLNSTTTDNNSSNNYNNTAHTLEQLNLNNSQLKKIINKDEVIGKETTLEEFGAILKSVGLTRELFEKLSQNKGFEKLTDSIEFFYKLCLEKNKQLIILEKENESLVFKNYELNKLNIELENELKLYKNTNDNLDKNLNKNNIKKILDDDSIINNQSQKVNQNILSKSDNNTNNNIDSNLNINSIQNSMINNNISNPLLNYKKLLEKQKEEGQLKQAEIIFNLSLEKENESSSSIKNSNNDAEILGNDNDNDNDNGNEEKEDDDKNDIENNLLYSNSNSKSLDAQFKQLYNDISNSNIDSILSSNDNEE